MPYHHDQIKPFAHTGLCRTCGKPTTEGNHENCGEKLIDSLKTKERTKKRYKRAAKAYREGKVPPWMYD